MKADLSHLTVKLLNATLNIERSNIFTPKFAIKNKCTSFRVAKESRRRRYQPRVAMRVAISTPNLSQEETADPKRWQRK